MGSSEEEEEEEEEKLIEMVRDFIESEPNHNPISPPPLSESPNSNHHKPTFSSLRDILEVVTDAETEILEKILSYLKENKLDISERNNNNLMKKGIVWGLIMDGFEASLCTTSWLATFGRPSGDYEYIDVMMKNNNGDGEATRVIVDMDFRSQFEVARPTQTYLELLNSIPPMFVGTEGKLMKLICLLCLAAKQSLRESGLHIPPWRKATYMQSKWLSENCKKISFSPMDFPNTGAKF